MSADAPSARRPRRPSGPRGANLALGRQLAERFHASALTKVTARLLLLLVVDAHGDDRAVRGLRYVREDWQELEVRTLKNGERRDG